MGSPSTPGWKGERLNLLTDWAVSSAPNRPIVCEYEPDGAWLWARWQGTVLSMTVLPIILVILASGSIDVVVHKLSSQQWGILDIPPANDPNVMELQGIRHLWEYQLTLCTFILTFFTQEAYRHYRTVYLTTRSIQGRINDICMLVTMGATRGEEELLTENRTSVITGYSDTAVDLVDTCTRLIRLSHTFFWAATPTASNGVSDTDEYRDKKGGKAIGPLLLSAAGLDGLVSAGELTAEERDSLQVLRQNGLPPSQYAYVLLEWVGLYVMDGRKAGVLNGDAGFEQNLFKQFTSLRTEYFNIGDYAAGRMPVAYVQLVQVLVDSLVALAPLAIYPDLGTLSIPLSGLLTLFFKGQLELSKSLLDPFGVEGFRGQNIRVDVLVSELNFGAGSRWVKAGEVLPKLAAHSRTKTNLSNSKMRLGSGGSGMRAPPPVKEEPPTLRR